MEKEKNHTKRSPLKIITYAAAVFTLACFSVFFIKELTHGSAFGSAAGALGMLTALVPMIFYNKMPKWLKYISAVCLSLYTVSFAVFCALVLGYSAEGAEALSAPGNGDNETVLVFGCRTYRTPSKELRSRLDRAYEILEGHPGALCIVSGGQGSNEPRTEASAMKEYLTGRGISEDRIYTEDRSSSTIENIENSAALINGTPRLSGRKIICVSSEFHLPRIGILMKKYAPDFSFVLSASESKNLFANLVREYLAYIKLIVLNNPF